MRLIFRRVFVGLLVFAAFPTSTLAGGAGHPIEAANSIIGYNGSGGVTQLEYEESSGYVLDPSRSAGANILNSRLGFDFRLIEGGSPQFNPADSQLYDSRAALNQQLNLNESTAGDEFTFQDWLRGDFSKAPAEINPDNSATVGGNFVQDNKTTANGHLGDPVDVVSGAFYLDKNDLSLAGVFPINVRRNYSSQDLGFSAFGYGWNFNITPYLVNRASDDGVTQDLMIAHEMDGTAVQYLKNSAEDEIDEGKVWRATTPFNEDTDVEETANRHLTNNSVGGIGGLKNILNQHIKLIPSAADNVVVDPDPVGDAPAAEAVYRLYGANGSMRDYYLRSYPLGSEDNDTLVTRERPYLYRWTDNRGNHLTFVYGEVRSRWDYGQMISIKSSSGAFLSFEYDSQGRVIEAYTNDGRRVSYTYNVYGDLTKVERPDNSVIEYRYKISTEAPSDPDSTVAPYSTHLMEFVEKPDGRLLKNEYDARRRVTRQWATVGEGLELVRNAWFVYGTDSNVDSGIGTDLTHARATDNVTGWTRVYDHSREPSQNPLEGEGAASDLSGSILIDFGGGVSSSYSPPSNCLRYEYLDGLITAVYDPEGRTEFKKWYTSRESYYNPNAPISEDGTLPMIGGSPEEFEPGGYARSLRRTVDHRGLITFYWYDVRGNVVLKKVYGDHTGSGAPETRLTRFRYDAKNRLLDTMTKVHQDSNSAVVRKIKITYHPTYEYLPEVTTEYIRSLDNPGISLMSIPFDISSADKEFSRQVSTYGETGGAGPVFAKGLLLTSVTAAGSPVAAHSRNEFDERGFLIRKLQFIEQGGAQTPSEPSFSGDAEVTLHHNDRGELIESTDRSGARSVSEYDAMGRPILSQVIQLPVDGAESKILATTTSHYNTNGEITWLDGPRYGPEDYVLKDYDAHGRVIAEIVWRSEALSDGTGVSAVDGQDDFLGQSMTRYVYDGFSNIVKTIDPRGNETVFTHDNVGRVHSQKSYQGKAEDGLLLAKSANHYYRNGDLRKTVNAEGAATEYTYTDLGQLLEQRNPDGTIVSREYYPDGRLKAERLKDKNGNVVNSWTTEYNERVFHEGKIAKVVTKKYISTITQGVGGNVQTVTYHDQRGNAFKSVDLDGYASRAEYDGLNRVTSSSGAEDLNLSETPFLDSAQQTSTTLYDLVTRKTIVENGLGERSLAVTDALGRAILSETHQAGAGQPSEATLLRKTEISYSDDHHSTTTVSGGTGEFPTTVTSFTDVSGRAVLTRKLSQYQEEGSTLSRTETTYSIAHYDRSGNLVTAIDELGQRTRSIYDGLNRPSSVEHPDGGIEYFGYNVLGNVTSHKMPGGLELVAEYDNIGRKKMERLAGDKRGSSRHFEYQYYDDGNHVALAKSSTDVLRGIVTDYAEYDGWRRPRSVNTTSTRANVVSVSKSYQYDDRGNLTQCVQTDGRLGSVTVDRSYDGYSQLLFEEVYSDSGSGGHDSLKNQAWDAAGRRVKLLMSDGTDPSTYTYGYDPDGKLSSVRQEEHDKEVTFAYTESGLLQQISSPWERHTIHERDQSGRILRRESRITDGVGGYVLDSPNPLLTSLNRFNETLSYRKDHRLAERSLRLGTPQELLASRYMWDNTYKQNYQYDAKGRLIEVEDAQTLSQVILNEPIRMNPGVFNGVSDFKYRYDDDQLGLLVEREKVINRDSSGGIPPSVENWSNDEFAREVQSFQLNGTSILPAYGHLNDRADIILYLTNQETQREYVVSEVEVAANTEPYTGIFTWTAEIKVPGGSYQMLAVATSPSGYVSTDTTTFTVPDTNSSEPQDKVYDEAGFPSRRELSDGSVQHLTWDVLGRLLEVVQEKDGSQDFVWKAFYDGFGRRTSWTYDSLQDGTVAGQRYTVRSYFDPSVEFLELGTSWGGGAADPGPIATESYSQQTIWRLYGPDLNGVYGGHNGIGGLCGYMWEESHTSSSFSEGVHVDFLGNTVATISESGRVSVLQPHDPYGPSDITAAIFDPAADSSAIGYSPKGLLALGWKSRSVDPTGLICMGTRYYDPYSARFISPDPLGHSASWDLYSYASCDPINYLDSDGRYGSNAYDTHIRGNSRGSLDVFEELGIPTPEYLTERFGAEVAARRRANLEKDWNDAAREINAAFSPSAKDWSDATFLDNLGHTISVGVTELPGAAGSLLFNMSPMGIVNDGVVAFGDGTDMFGERSSKSGAYLGLALAVTPVKWGDDILEAGYRASRGAPNSAVYRTAGNVGSDPVTLKQLKMSLGRSNMSVKNFELQHVSNITDAWGNPAFGNMVVDGAGNVMKGASGKPLIQISDLGLSSLDDGVATVFHEIHHIRSAKGLGRVSSEGEAEAFAQKMLQKFQSRSK